MNKKLYFLMPLFYTTLLSACGKNSLQPLPDATLPNGQKVLTLNEILPNAEAISSMKGEFDEEIFANLEVISVDRGVSEEEGLYTFAANSFYDNGNFFYASRDLNIEDSNLADLSYIAIPKNLNLDYSTFALVGYRHILSKEMHNKPVIVYNHDMVYENNFDKDLSFTGKAMLNYSGKTEINGENTNFSGNGIVGNALLNINSNERTYDLKMDFDNFYSIHLTDRHDENNPDNIVNVYLSNEDKLPEDLKNKIAVPLEDYMVTAHDIIPPLILGKDSPEEVVGDFNIDMDLSTKDIKSHIEINGAYGGKVNN